MVEVAPVIDATASFRAFTGFEGFVTGGLHPALYDSRSFRAFTGFEGFVTHSRMKTCVNFCFRAFTGFEGFVTNSTYSKGWFGVYVSEPSQALRGL